MSLGERIQELRKSSHLSQEQLGEKLQLSRQAVSKWEAGQSIPELDKIIQLSELFDVTTDYLLKGKEAEKSKALAAPHEQPPGSGHKARGNLSGYPVLGTGITLIGLVVMIIAWTRWYTELAFGTGIVIQIVGCLIFEFTQARQKETDRKGRLSAHLKFYAVNAWFLLFLPVAYMAALRFNTRIFLMPFKFYFVPYIAICTLVTALLIAALFMLKSRSTNAALKSTDRARVL